MTDPMVSFYDPPRTERVEVITSVQRWRRWTTEEKVRIVAETYLPGQSVSIIVRRHESPFQQRREEKREGVRTTTRCALAGSCAC